MRFQPLAPSMWAVAFRLLAHLILPEQGRGEPEQKHAGLVDERVDCEITGMLASGFEYQANLFAEGARAEKEDHAMTLP